MNSYWNKSKGESLEYSLYLLLTGFDFYIRVYLAVPSLCHLMIFHEGAKVKIIAQAAAVASAPLANKMLISEWAPCCREALLEGSYSNCSNWSFACTCFLCVWCGSGRHNTENRFVSLAWYLSGYLGRQEGRFCMQYYQLAFNPWFCLLCLRCEPCFPGMLSDKEKKACVWRLEYSLNHTFCDS